MSPKQITRMGLLVGALSIVGTISMIVIQPAWGLINWWPALGLALSLLLFITAFLKGAYLVAQKRADMVDLLNDCYSGNAGQKEGRG